MKKIKTFVTALLLFSSVISFAQVPGYLGKRFSVGYDFNFFPYMNFIVWGSEHPEFLTWANKHEFSASFALGRKCTFSASYAMSRQEYYFQEGDVTVYNPMGGYTYNSTFYSNPKMVPVKADFIDFRLKFSGKNFI